MALGPAAADRARCDRGESRDSARLQQAESHGAGLRDPARSVWRTMSVCAVRVLAAAPRGERMDCGEGTGAELRLDPLAVHYADMKTRLLLVAVALASVTLLHAQAPAAFKLGTFERQGKPFVGVVVGNATVIDLAAAARVTVADMKDLIGRYGELRPRIAEAVANVQRAGAQRPANV